MQDFQLHPPRVQREYSIFPLKKKERHDLPTQRIPSRMCHAEIWSLFGLKKEVSITLIKLSKASRNYIVSQEGLKGFCQSFHESSETFNYHWQTISKPVVDLLSDIIPKELREHKNTMILFFRIEDKERLCEGLAKTPKS